MILGLIIAGGRSERFGSDKALARVDGRPMIARVAAVLQAGCEEVAVNAPLDSAVADWALAEGLAVLADPSGVAQGPLAGVLAGLGWAGVQGVTRLATAPCDMPWLPFDLVPRLDAALSDPAGAAMAACGEDLHPLCALWRTDRRDAVVAMMTGDRHPSMRRALTAVDAAIVRFDDAKAFANINTKDDLSR